MNTNSSIGKKYKLTEVKDREFFSISKFVSGMFGLFSPSDWGKDLASLFNIRKLLIFALIIGAIFGYGYWKGRINQPLQIELEDYKDAYIKLLDGNVLHIRENGTVCIKDKDGNILKELKNKDINILREELKTYGFQLKPIAIFGTGLSTDGSLTGEVGIGVRWFKAWRFRIESFLTQKAIYPLGISYKLDEIGLKNSSIGVGVGTSYNNFLEDKRILCYFSLEF